jgi:hypothetical protein
MKKRSKGCAPAKLRRAWRAVESKEFAKKFGIKQSFLKTPEMPITRSSEYSVLNNKRRLEKYGTPPMRSRTLLMRLPPFGKGYPFKGKANHYIAMHVTAWQVLSNSQLK